MTHSLKCIKRKLNAYINKYQFSAYLIPITNISKSFISLTNTAADPIISTFLIHMSWTKSISRNQVHTWFNNKHIINTYVHTVVKS